MIEEQKVLYKGRLSGVSGEVVGVIVGKSNMGTMCPDDRRECEQGLDTETRHLRRWVLTERGKGGRPKDE